MATRTLLKRLAYREVHVNVPPLTRLSVDVPLWHGEGAKTARNFTRRFLPTIRFHQNDAFVATLKRSADVPKPAITVEYADGKTREFDPAEVSTHTGQLAAGCRRAASTSDPHTPFFLAQPSRRCS